jgi:hypothetical protein
LHERRRAAGGGQVLQLAEAAARCEHDHPGGVLHPHPAGRLDPVEPLHAHVDDHVVGVDLLDDR